MERNFFMRGLNLLTQREELARRWEENKKSPAKEAALLDNSILPQAIVEDLAWGEVSSLPPLRQPLPSLPEEIVPAALLPWLNDIKKGACVPLEYVATPAIIGLAAVVGRKLGIRPEQYAYYTVVPNLWGAIVGRPGSMKSYAVSEPLKPLRRLEESARKAYDAEKADSDLEKKERQIRIDSVEKKWSKAIASGGDDADVYKCELEALMNEEQAAITQRRYLTQDATVEKLGELMNENPNGLLLTRDELAGWLLSLDKPGREGDREFYLESWNGNDGYQVDRIGRGSFYIKSNCLSAIGGIQPGKLQSFFAGGLQQDSKGDDGFLQRLQLLIWPDDRVEWVKPTVFPSKAVKEQAYAVYEKLDRLTPADVGAAGEEGEIPYLTFTDAAQAIWDAWRNDLERRLRGDEGMSEAFDSHLSKYRSLMPSLALIFHLVDVVSGAAIDTRYVGESSVKQAVQWCHYLELHALKLYAPTFQPELNTAHLLADRIKNRQIKNGMTIRDIWKRGWSGLRDAESVRHGLEELQEYGWVVVETELTGGRPTTVVRLNPKLIFTDSSCDGHPKPPKAVVPQKVDTFGCFGGADIEASLENVVETEEDMDGWESV